MISDERIVRDGTPWPQRIAAAGGTVSDTSDRDLLAWQQAVDPDEVGLFARRLAWDGLTENDARGVLAERPAAPEPDWLVELNALRQAARAGTAEPDPALADIAFDALWSPMVADAWRRLAAEVDQAALSTLSTQAGNALRRDLGRRLAEVAQHACYAQFTRSRPAGTTVMLQLNTTAGTTGTGAYRLWCQRQLGDGLEALLTEFPVLGRLLAVTALAWRSATTALIQRVHHARAHLWQVLGVPVDAPVTAIAAGLSDSHRGGHSVAVLEFGTDTPIRVVYKPKDLRLEQGFQDLIAELNTWFGDHLLTPVEVVTQPDHGFTSFIAHRTSSQAELPDFYRAAGRLTALLHLLGATDAHYENVIATGPGLALVDAETLLRPRLLDIDEPGPLADSVLGTGMLPNWVLTGPDQVAYDPSALGVQPDAEPAPVPGWAHVNTDAMIWTPVRPAAFTPHCLPVAAGIANPLAEHVESLVAGLREVLTACQDDGLGTLLLAGLARLRGLPQRVVLRATRIYGLTLANATSATSLRDANARAMHLERLTRSSLIMGRREPHWLVYRAEVHDLENGDVPFFDHRLGSAIVTGSLGPIPGLIVGDALAEAVQRITDLDDDAVRWQEGLVRGSILARFTTTDQAGPSPDARGSTTAPSNDIPGELLQQIVDEAVPGPEPTWLTLSRLPDGQRVRLGLIRDGWYDGRAGIAAAQQYGQLRPTTTAAPVLGMLRDAQPYVRWRYLRALGLGFGGVGGLLRWLGLTTGDPTLDTEHTRVRRNLVEELPAQLVAADRTRDFIGGVAGLIGPLAQIVRDDPTPAGSHLLTVAAEHLRAGQQPDGGWLSRLGERPLTGLAHGAAGNGIALLEAGVALQRGDLIEAGVAAFSYEAAVYDRAGNWPDFRSPGAEPMTAWCHGAPGIGLTRLRALRLLPDHPRAGLWHDELGIAMSTTATAPLPTSDHLCCGLAGRAAVLRIAGRATGEAPWCNASDDLTDQLAHRYLRGGLQLPTADPHNPVTSSPGLMTGLAGIAAHLLSCQRDDDLGAWLL